MTRSEQVKEENESMMKTYYSTTMSVYDDMRVVIAVTDSVQAESKPEDRCTEMRDRDVYTEWFDSIEEAKAYVKACKRA